MASPPSPPALSIVIPVLDEAAHIEHVLGALSTLRAGGSVEIVVVDGGSGDGTPERCAGLCDAVLTAPRGRAAQMNAGAHAARGDALLFLHADTRLPDGAVPALLAALADRAWGRFDVSIEGRAPLLPLVAAMMNLRSRLSGIATGDQAIFMRRSAYGRVGGFPAQPLMEDIEVSRRLLRACGRPACLRLKVRTSGRRWDQRGFVRTVLLMWRLRLLYWLGVPAERLAKAYR